MPRKSWSDAVADAARRHVANTGSLIFTRREFIESELHAVVAETGSVGVTPHQTLSRELQQLRDAGAVEFLAHGTYRWIGFPFEVPLHGTSKAIFVIGAEAKSRGEPESVYRFDPRWMKEASRAVGNWIIYLDMRFPAPPVFYAAAKVERIIADPTATGHHLALIEPGSFLEFGREVPYSISGQTAERVSEEGGPLSDGQPLQSIRLISDAEFNRIVDHGLVDEDDPLARSDDDESSREFVQEERDDWEGPVDRPMMLVNRTVRNRQFRKRVLQAYGCRCALTGMRLINGGGRPEAEAAHIMSVKAGGPDRVNNGIALSGTVHWMFDRGLISLSDEGTILLSRKINDLESVEKLIHTDRQARLPSSSARPHRRYLQWHRNELFEA